MDEARLLQRLEPMKRYALLIVLFVVTVAAPALLLEKDAHARQAADVGAATVGTVAPTAWPIGQEPDIPAAVRAAEEEGRYWRASRLMDQHLATVSDTTPEVILFTARLNAGWGQWRKVSELLEGRDWLDTAEGGIGWELLGRSRIAQDRPAEGARALARYIELGPTDWDRGVAELRRGLALGEADAAGEAQAAFERAGRLLPWLRDWSSLFAAETAAAAGDTAVVRARLAEAGALAPAGGWRLRLNAARAAGDSMAAREIALETAQSAAGATRAAAWASLGALRLASGDTARARSAYWEAMQSPAAAGAVEGARVLTDLTPSPEEWRRIAEIYARHGNAGRAARGYAAYLESGQGTPAERYRIRLQLGSARFNAGSYAEAERGLLALAASDGVPSDVGAEALYLAGRAQYRQGRSQDGQRTLAQLPDRFPGEEAVTRGLYLLADLKHDDLEIGDARRFYRQAADASPALSEAGLSLMRLGGLDLLNGDHEGAVEVFEEYRRLHPDGRRWGQSTYWAARAYEALGREADAQARLRELREKEPISFYGVRAAELLALPVLPAAMASGPAAGSAGDEAILDGLRRVDVLLELGRSSDAAREVARLRSSIEGQTPAEYALAEALIERGHTPTAINLGWDIYRRAGAWNQRLLRVVYPFPFRQMVLPEARRLDLDPYLVAGLIRQESAFSPAVRSGAGATGLMQVMPETGRMLAREVGLGEYDPEMLEHPELNVHLGTRYLAAMLNRFDGVLPLVLSAYNAGPTRAARWRDFPEARDMELFVERVPYGETRDYIRRVLTNRALYQALYPTLGDGGA